MSIFECNKYGNHTDWLKYLEIVFRQNTNDEGLLNSFSALRMIFLPK